MSLSPAEIEAIAQRVAELIVDRLAESDRARLVDAAHVAQLLGVERDWVYAHADQLGAIRLGGPRGRLRFDLETVTARADRTRQAPDPRRPRGRRSTPGERRPTTQSSYHLHSAAQTYNKGGRAALERPRP